MRTKSQPSERDERVLKQEADRLKETREFANKEQTGRKRLENLRTRSKPLERDCRVQEQVANRMKMTREFEKT